MSTSNTGSPLRHVELLILGAGWTSLTLIPLLQSQNISYAATTTTGRNNTIKFTFDPDSDDMAPYKSLPLAKTVLITFPLKGPGQSKKITGMYSRVHAPEVPNWVQLGSTGIFQSAGWNDHNSDHDAASPRAVAEDELLELHGCVLNLAGLYGAGRDPRNWVSRVARTKEQVRAKGALHLVHGEDVARAVVGVHRKFSPGDRWIVTDRHVYDWWDLVDAWGGELTDKWQGEGERPEYRRWVQECMRDDKVRALPRSPELLGRVVDSEAFWNYIGILPMERLSR